MHTLHTLCTYTHTSAHDGASSSTHMIAELFLRRKDVIVEKEKCRTQSTRFTRLMCEVHIVERQHVETRCTADEQHLHRSIEHRRQRIHHAIRVCDKIKFIACGIDVIATDDTFDHVVAARVEEVFGANLNVDTHQFARCDGNEIFAHGAGQRIHGLQQRRLGVARLIVDAVAQI